MNDKEQLDLLVRKYTDLRTEIAKVIVGQTEAVDGLLLTLFSGGHCLLLGVPGLAKTLMVSTLARTLGLTFNRIQFTPDLMPSDITGSEILNQERRLSFVRGPLFAGIVLADEINRTPPKTQAALLEAMQEHSVTVAGTTYPLPTPFLVLATQNPIEQEGTYPLPEAQLDRFMFNIKLDYPSFDEEVQTKLSKQSSCATSVVASLTDNEAGSSTFSRPYAACRWPTTSSSMPSVWSPPPARRINIYPTVPVPVPRSTLSSGPRVMRPYMGNTRPTPKTSTLSPSPYSATV